MNRTSILNRIVGSLASVVVALVFAPTALAQNSPHSLNISGGLFNSSGAALSQAGVNFKIEILDKNASCVLYSEQHLNQDLSATKGAFSLLIGEGSSIANKLENSAAFTAKIFVNNGATGAFTGCAAGVTNASGDERLIRVYYDIGAGFIAMTPDVPVVSSAFALVAESLQGKNASDFAQINTGSAALSQANLENIFSNVNYPKLNALVNGSSTQYLAASPSAAVDFNSQRLTSVATPTSATDAANKSYADSNVGGKTVDVTGVGAGVGGGKTLVWDQALNKWVAQTPSSALSQIVAGTGLVATTITSAGTLAVDVGTTANKIVQLNAQGKLPALDGFLLTNIAYPVSSVAGRTGAVTLNAADISGLGTAATKTYGTAANNLVELNASAQLPAVDGSLLTNVNATQLQSRSIAATAPAAGQVLTWNATTSVWEPRNASVSGITDLTGDVSASGSGSVAATIANSAITSAKINASGYAINRLLITDSVNPNLVTYANCSNGDVLKYGPTGWLCNSTTGSVSLLVSGTGLVAGSISTAGTLNVDVGTTAGKILQLTAGAQYPNVDGNLIANINAVKIQARNISANAPAGGQVLGWNSSSNQWEPTSTAGVGTVTAIYTGTGLVANSITASGTISVDTGTTANKILQLNASAQIPSVDGSLISNTNAARLQSRTLASTAPTANQVLTWNNTTSQWEPQAAQASANDFVQNGNAFGVTAKLGTTDITNLNLLTCNNTQMTITSGGNVGIGTTIPATPLHVERNANTTTNVFVYNNSVGAAASAGINLHNGTDSAIFSLAGTGAGRYLNITNPGPGGIFYTVANAGGDHIFQTGAGSSEKMRLTSNGLLGIGNPTPGVALDVNGTGLFSGLVVPRDTTALRPTPVNGLIRYNTNTSKFEAYESGAWTNVIGSAGNAFLQNGNAFGTTATLGTTDFTNLNLITNNSTRMVITSSGNVGIGTASPAFALDVTGLALFRNTLAVNNSLSSSAFQSLNFFTNNSVILAMTLTSSSGSVGIGTSTPNVALDVNGTGTFSGLIVPRATTALRPASVNGTIRYNTNTSKFEAYEAGAWINLSASGAGGFVNGGNAFGANASLGTTDVTNLSLLTCNNTQMTITSQGNVGIGTTTPSAPLNISTTGTVTSGSAQSILTSLNVNPASASSAVFSGQNVNLSLSGTSNLTGSIYGTSNTITNNDSGTVSNLYGTYNNPIQSYTTGTTSTLVGTYNDSANQNGTSTAAYGDYNYIRNSNAGTIGSAFGAYNWIRNVSNGNITTAYGNNSYIQNTGTGTISTAYGDFITAPTNSGGGAITTYYGLYIQTPTVAGTNFALYSQGGTNYFGGNVGIGNSAPSVGLDVNATGTFSGLIVPRATTALRPASVNGTIRYNTNTSKFEAYESGSWVNLSANGAGGFINGGNAFGSTAQLGTTDVTNLSFLTCNNTQMTITSRGSVGVGTTSPSTLFEVYGGSAQFTTSSSTISRPIVSYNPYASAVADKGAGIRLRSSVDLGYIDAAQSDATTNEGYLAFSTRSGSNVAEKMRLTNVGTLGIGTSTPAAALDVNGTGTFSAIIVPRDTTSNRPAALVNGMLRYNTNTSKFEAYEAGAWVNLSASGAGGFVNGGNAFGSNASLGTTDVTNLTFLTCNNAQMTITSGGNVGIGTTSPGSTLDVAGWINVSSAYTYRVGGLTVLSKPSSKILVGDTGANSLPMGLFTYGLERMTIDGSGNVGLGNTNPAAVLDITSTNTFSGLIIPRATTALRPTAVNGMLRYNTNTSKFEAYEGGSWVNLSSNGAGGFVNGGNAFGGTATLGTTDTGNLNIVSNSSPRMTINGTTGYVGVNTTGPAAPLSVGGTGKLLSVGDGANQSSYIDLDVMRGSIGYDPVAPGTLGATTIESGLGKSIAFVPNLATFGGGTAAMLINSSGLVGIGTTSPGAVLDVNSTGTFSSLILPRDTTANRNAAPTNGMIRYNTNTSKFEAYEGGSWVNLSSNGAGGFINGGNAFGSTASLGTTDVTNLNLLTCNNVQVTITSRGNVGIGTTAPAYPLDVNGQIHASNTITGFNYQAISSGAFSPLISYISSSAVDQKYWDFTQTASGSFSLRALNDTYASSNNAITFNRNGYSISSVVIPSGAVGIGTTTPNVALDVNGTGTFSALIVPRDTTANRPTALVNGMIRYNTNTARFEAYEGGGWTNLSASGSSAFINGGNAFGSTASLGTTDVTNLNFLSCNNVQMTITSRGNVGIGTTSPGARLHVVGGQFYVEKATQSWAATTAISFDNGNVQDVTLGGTTTFTFSNPKPGATYTLIIKQDATGSRTVTWPATVKWPGGVAPVLTTTTNAVDIFTFVSDGTNYYNLGYSSDVK